MLTIIRGLPGSGKTTLANTIGEYVHERYEADMYFTNVNGHYNYIPEKIKDAHEWCQKNVANALSRGEDTIVSNTFTTNKEMLPYITAAHSNGHQIQVLECHASFGSVHNVPAEVIQRMAARWEMLDRSLLTL